MQFERLVALAQDTDTSVLCEAWGVHAEAVQSVKKSEHPNGVLADLHKMSIRDFADLAESIQTRPSQMWDALERRHGPSGSLG